MPANAPHAFRNAAEVPARLLCMCTPPGQEKFFTAFGTAVSSRTEASEPLGPDAQAAFVEKVKRLSPDYRTAPVEGRGEPEIGK